MTVRAKVGILLLAPKEKPLRR